MNARLPLDIVSSPSFLKALQREKDRRDASTLAAFARAAWPVLEPTQPLAWGWALDAICDHLAAVSRGDIKRLLMNVPPGPMRHDSVVETSRGQVLLRDVKEGDLVLTHKGRYRRVEAVHDQGVLPILKITTSSGRVTHAAPSHPYLTPTGWVAASDLTPGDVLAVVNRSEDRANAIPLSEEEARFLGYIVGDGSVTHATNFVNNDSEVIDDFVRCCKALGFKTTVRQRQTFFTVSVAGAKPLLITHGLAGKSSYTKRIPVAVMNSTADTLRQFLGAYWTCDGGIDVRATRTRGSAYRAYATTVGEGLAQDLLMALSLVGIEARIRTKQRKLETAAQPGGVYRSYSIEVQNESMTARVVALPSLCSAKTARGTPCASDFDRPLWEDKIVSIEEDAPAHCLCLTVEEDHSFTCSGIAVKNSMKSLMTGVIWPAWEWGPNAAPSLRYLATAHKQDLAVRDNMKCRRLIQSEWYQSLWPIELTGDQNAKTKFENTETGFREAMAFTSMTGSRGDRVILDDPLSVDDAHSEAALESAERTFKEALPTRVNNDRSAIVVIMQRLHERDTSGIILDLKLGYEHLCLPMRFEASRRCKTSIGFVDPRKKDGELFFPERFSEETVASLEAILGEYATAGQLQQRPSPAEGGIIKRSWFKLMQSDGDLPKLQFIVQSYDTAFTDKTLNDATAMVTWGVFNTPQGKAVLLLDAWKDRLQYPDLRRKMYDEYKSAYGDNEKKVDVVLIEEKGSGISLVQDLRRARIPIHTYNPGNANKSTRVHSVAPLIEAGLVYLPASKKRPGQAPVWTDEMMHELLAFPNAEHDDYVDAFTQSLIYLRDSGLLTIDADKYDKEYPTAPRERENPYAA